MDIGNKKIILASGSPRRRELLAGLDIEFEIDTRNSFEESYSSNTPHRKIPVLMAEGKSSGFHRPILKDEILITADTMVLCGNRKIKTNVNRIAGLIRFFIAISLSLLGWKQPKKPGLPTRLL